MILSYGIVNIILTEPEIEIVDDLTTTIHSI
jgi:hypothetical protein